MIKKLLLIIFFVLSTKEAYSASGKQLKDDCTGEEIKKISCLYFLGGFGAAGMEINERLIDYGSRPLWCEKSKITWTYRRKIVLNYIYKNPKSMRSPAPKVIIDAHIEAFPC